MWHWAAQLPGDAPALQLELKDTFHSGWDYVTDSLPGQEGEVLRAILSLGYELISLLVHSTRMIHT